MTIILDGKSKKKRQTSPLAGEDEFRCELESVRNSGEGSYMSHRFYAPYIKEFARDLRRTSTPQERKLWALLKSSKTGFKFRRQFVVDNKYIADFVCLETRLIVEIDGGQHNGCFNDADRTFYMEQLSFTIIRFWNNEIDKNIEGCYKFIIDVLNTPHPSPLPQGAREQRS
jgi:very-short-patch-repair endonuclease